MNFPKELKYTKDHEWIRVEGALGVVGITDYAQHALGDVVFAELPKVGDELQAGKSAGVVESVKSVSDILSPVSGVVVEANSAIDSSPDLVNKGPYAEGWMFKLKMSDKKELDLLMGAAEYEKLVGEKK
jgi:glycine cleavage system H protein